MMADDDSASNDDMAVDTNAHESTEPNQPQRDGDLPTKPPPTVDVTVHRLRHLQFHPKPILALQVANDSGFLAVSRDNGQVELKELQKLRTVATIAGYRRKPVNLLSWLCSPADSLRGNDALSSSTKIDSNDGSSLPPLIGASNDGTIFRVDFECQRFSDIIPSGGGAVFALTTKCRRTPCKGSCCCLVAGGCQDGVTRIWRVSFVERDGSEGLSLVSTLPSTGAPVLSLAWRPNDNASGSTLYAAVADGTIRRYDEPGSLHWSSTLRMTVESLGRTTPTRVWALEVLGDGTLISADSLGHVQLWSGTTGTLQQTIDQNDNKADVLCLAVSQDETKIYASGVDSRVICIEPVPMKRQIAEGYYGPMNKWMLSYAHRPHTHDVNALVIVRQPVKKNVAPSDTRSNETQEILCSGGIDTKLCTYSVQDGRKKRPRTLYPWPSNLVSVARKLRALVMLREESVDIYRLGPKQAKDESFPVSFPPEKTLIGSVHVEGTTNLACVSIRDDGRFLVVSDALSLSIFRLEFIYDDGILVGMQQPQKVKIEVEDAFAVSAVCFHTDDKSLVCSAQDGSIRIVSIVDSPDPFATMMQVHELQRTSKASQSLVMSPDGSYFATMQSIRAGGKIKVYRTTHSGETITCHHWWSLPLLPLPSCVMSFLPSNPAQLAVACTNFGLYVFNVEERKLSTWSEAAGYPISSLPNEFLNRNDYPVHITVNPASPSKVLVASCGAFVVFDLDKPFPTASRFFPERHVRGKKRKRSLSIVSESGAEVTPDIFCTMCLRYNSMLCFESLDDDELLVVEQPWLNVVATFPEALQRKVYAS